MDKVIKIILILLISSVVSCKTPENTERELLFPPENKCQNLYNTTSVLKSRMFFEPENRELIEVELINLLDEVIQCDSFLLSAYISKSELFIRKKEYRIALEILENYSKSDHEITLNKAFCYYKLENKELFEKYKLITLEYANQEFNKDKSEKKLFDLIHVQTCFFHDSVAINTLEENKNILSMKVFKHFNEVIIRLKNKPNENMIIYQK